MYLNKTQSEPAWHIAALALLILISFFAALGAMPLFDIDEGVFGEATREMMISKNYITTYLNGVLRFDKPILIYWLQLASVKLFGLDEFALRLPSALAGTAWATSIFLFVRKESGSRQAFLATAIMVLSLQIMVIAKAAMADGVLNCFLAITMLALLHYYKTGTKQVLYLAFAAAGLGMLTKGPIALIIPFVVTFLFSLLEGTVKQWLRMICNPIGIVIFLVIALPWYLLEYRDQGMAFIAGFFFKHNVSRFSSVLEGHSGSIFYYIPVLIFGMMPFTALFFSIFFKLKILLTDTTNKFLFIWFAFVFIFFTISGTKLHHYIIYGYTPLFILMARTLPLMKFPERLAVFPLILLGALTLLPLSLPIALRTINDLQIQALLHGAMDLTGQTYLIVVTTTIAGMVIILLLPRLSNDYKLIAMGAIFSLFINLYLAPLAGKLIQEPVKEAALLAKKEGYKVVMWKTNNPSFLVYSESLVEKRAPKPGEIVMTTIKQIHKLDHPVILYSKYGMVMAKLR